jgi:hypothetical protein
MLGEVPVPPVSLAGRIKRSMLNMRITAAITATATINSFCVAV